MNLVFAKIFDRLVYAVIGLIFGAIAAVLLWIFVHHDRLAAVGGSFFDRGFVTWLEVLAGTFAVIGFVVKDEVGSAIGGALDVTFKAAIGDRSSESDVPTWIVVAVLVGVAVLVWHFGQAP